MLQILKGGEIKVNIKNKGWLIPVAFFGLIVFGGFLVKQAKADEVDTYGRSGIIERLVEKFNLDEQEVEEEVFRLKEDHRAEKLVRREDGLNRAVEDGVITEDQKEMLLDKHEELCQNRTQTRDDMHQWMENQGIDLDALSEYGVGRVGLGCGGDCGGGGRGGHQFKGI